MTGESNEVESQNYSRSSTWATISLLCSFAVCCPIMSLIGPIAGLRALLEIKANPNVRGRNTAVAGISVGTAAILFWIIVAVWWHFNARLPMLQGPQAALVAGSRGDMAGFKGEFYGEGADLPDADAAAFVSELSRRYGSFVASTQSTITPSGPPPTGSTDFRLAYTLAFDRGTVECEGLFTTFGKARVVPSPVFKWKWVRIVDPVRGDLVYPAVAAPEASAKPAPQAATQTTSKP